MPGSTSSPEGKIAAKRIPRDGSSVAKQRTAGRVTTQRPARQIRLADQLYEQILRRIVAGQLSEGDRLPSEMELSRSFQVSRPVVREALMRLRADGLVAARKGSGTYVRRCPAPDFMDLAPGGSIADLFRCWELRIPVECEAAFLAAQRRTSADLRAIEGALKEFEGLLTTLASGSDADLRFHRAVAAASGNQLFVSVLDTMHDSIDQGMKLAHRLSWTDNKDRLRVLLDEHLPIFEAIAARDSEAAREAMRHHVENSRDRILGARNQTGALFKRA